MMQIAILPAIMCAGNGSAQIAQRVGIKAPGVKQAAKTAQRVGIKAPGVKQTAKTAQRVGIKTP